MHKLICGFCMYEYYIGLFGSGDSALFEIEIIKCFPLWKKMTNPNRVLPVYNILVVYYECIMAVQNEMNCQGRLLTINTFYYLPNLNYVLFVFSTIITCPCAMYISIKSWLIQNEWYYIVWKIRKVEKFVNLETQSSALCVIIII